MSVRVVTDSASDIDGELAWELGIAVVPLNVHFGTRTFEDNVTITPDELYGMLATTSEAPMTSQASPGRFKEVYDEFGRDADGIVSVHISSKLSGTCNSARQGALATSASCPVEVIDSGQASMGLGLVNLPGYTRTSMPMRPSGAGRERRPPRTCAWEAGGRCRRGSAVFSPDWPAGDTR